MVDDFDDFDYHPAEVSMSVLPHALFQELRSVLINVGRNDLVVRLDEAIGENLLTSTEAAELLGVSSPSTVKNWLMSGHFPGAFQTPGGHWRFPRAEVEAERLRLEQLRERNRRGDLSLPDEDHEGEPPLL